MLSFSKLKLKIKGSGSSENLVVKPGENITLRIESRAKSVVSLAAVDQRYKRE